MTDFLLNLMYEDVSGMCKDLGPVLRIVGIVVLIIKIVVPIILIIVGMVDLAKAVTEKSEDKIKAAQQGLIKKAIAAVLVFFVTLIVQIVIKFAASSDANVVNCMNCFINGEVSENSCILADE